MSTSHGSGPKPCMYDIAYDVTWIYDSELRFSET